MLKALLAMMLTGVPMAAVTEAPEPVQRAAWEIVVMTLGGVSAALAVLAAVWWLLRPRVEAWAKALVAQMTRVEQQVTPNGHSTPEEREVSTADRLVQLQRVSARNTHAIDALTKHVADRDRKGRGYVADVIVALRAQGVEIPEPPDEDTEL